ncbi:MAG: ribose-phosphate pyrophosphokinase [Bacteroidota bacterium]|nr:ribose-phosphate pyrophosphokinase [Bacteroidota bacterium]
MPARFNPVKIFSCTQSTYLAEKIAAGFGQDLGSLSTTYFSDGEFQPSFNESVRGCDVFIVQSTFAPSDNLMELLLCIDAAKRASAHYITAVVPYFGFARQDRKDKPRVAIGSKLVANLLASAGISRIMTMDLHAPQIQGFFEVPVDHLDSSVIFIPYIRNLGMENLVIAAPDMGGSQRARYFAQHLLADIVICDKHRKRANQIDSMRIIGDVVDKDIVIVDDIVDTGGTLSRAAQLMVDNGAKSVRALCTHPVLSGKAIETIENSILTELVVCDTIPLKVTCSKIKVLSAADLFANAIRNVYEYGSISSLFTMPNSMQVPLGI